MKKIYLTGLLLLPFFFIGCSKDILKSYDTRIIGTWKIEKVNRLGFGGNTDDLPFNTGTFVFNKDGTLIYTNTTGATYNGTWDLQKKLVGEDTFHSLQITVVDFANQHVLAQYYDDVNFSGTNHLKGRIHTNFHTFVTHFRR